MLCFFEYSLIVRFVFVPEILEQIEFFTELVFLYITLARLFQVLQLHLRSGVSKCRLRYLRLRVSSFLKSGCSGYLKHPKFQVRKPSLPSCCAISFRAINFFDLLRIKILEHGFFWLLQLWHGCSSQKTLLSTGLTLAGRNRLVSQLVSNSGRHGIE